MKVALGISLMAAPFVALFVTLYMMGAWVVIWAVLAGAAAAIMIIAGGIILDNSI